MLRVEVTEGKTNQRSFVSFFDDDTVDTIRQQIGRTLDTHPDRLLILARIERPADYYKRNPQRWEALFNRLSLTQPVIQKLPFSEYQTFYRSPASSIMYSDTSRSEWMEVPDSLKKIHSPEESFSEYIIFGVPEESSFILPRSYDPIVTKIPAAAYPIPDTSRIITSLYDIADLRGFYCIPYEEQAENVQPVYFPFLRATTPSRLSEEEVNLLNLNSKRITDLLALKSPEPTKVSIVRTRFHVPWIETDFGSAIRTRFEQMFYGLTVSNEVPCITLFNSNSEVSRHKFYVENTKKKEPFLDLQTWNSWWTNTKPSRNRPTLVLYRGKTNQHFDRVSITAVDMVVSTYRPEGNTQSLEQLQKEVQEWIVSFDSILPFVNETDLDESRWELQDMSFIAKYSKTLEHYDLRRFACVSSIFDLADANNSVFRFLRSDYSIQGVTAVEMKVLQMMRENPDVGVADISKELSVSADRARTILRETQNRIEEDPKILEKAFRGFPTMRMGPNTMLISSTTRLEKSLEYANILRYILTSPDAEDIDAVCPKRLEKVAAKEIQLEEQKVDQAVLDEYMDLVGDIDIDTPAPTKEEVEDEEEQNDEKILVKSDRKTLYNYFNARLQKFDHETYNTNNPDYEYPRKCEQKHQPIILSDADLKRINGSPYDPRTYAEENQMLDIDKGIIICPEYWCMRDELPLQEAQLIDEDGFQRCPMCSGKVKQKLNQNPNEFTVIKRDKAFQYPKYTKYKSPTNGQLMPCCYKTPESATKKEPVEDKYYILGETKTAVPPMRISFIQKEILDGLMINETYEIFKKQARIQSPMSGYFRVGIGRPSDTIPKLLNLKLKIPRPRENIQLVLKCSFFSTWTRLAEEGYEDIEEEIESDALARRIAGIDYAFEHGELSLIQELEYTALALQCEVFRVLSDSKTLDCFFPVRMSASRRRGIIVLQDGNVFTAVSFIRRSGNLLTYTSNIYEPPFKKATYEQVEKLRSVSCNTAIPSYDKALSAIQEIMSKIDAEEYSIVLDPYVRGQALYIPGKLILPFQATPLPSNDNPKINGFENIKELPTHENVLKYLEIAQKYSAGYAWAEDMCNSAGERVEVRVKSGLRIPVVPEMVHGETTEVIESVNTIGERKMTFGDGDTSLKATYSEISYASEIFEFLLFELSNTLDDYPDLRARLASNPTRANAEDELSEWFEDRTRFIDITKPTEFISKVRTPCGQFKTKNTCTGNVCGWDGTCRVNIRSTTKKGPLFHRLLSTLVENNKIRSIVLDQRVTPFFSTILYMELPHELILSDSDVKM